MKIRIKGNSIRLRLSKSEVERFGKTNCIEESTEFGTGVFYYALLSNKAADCISASFSGNKITVIIPEKIKTEWTTTDRVGFENKLDIGNGKQLFILIEKDFVCLDNTFEDQSDNFPNPNAACGTDIKTEV